MPRTSTALFVQGLKTKPGFPGIEVAVRYLLLGFGGGFGAETVLGADVELVFFLAVLLEELVDFFLATLLVDFVDFFLEEEEEEDLLFLSLARRAAASLFALIRALSLDAAFFASAAALSTLAFSTANALASAASLSARLGPRGPQLANKKLIKMSPIRDLGKNRAFKINGGWGYLDVEL